MGGRPGRGMNGQDTPGEVCRRHESGPPLSAIKLTHELTHKPVDTGGNRRTDGTRTSAEIRGQTRRGYLRTAVVRSLNLPVLGSIPRRQPLIPKDVLSRRLISWVSPQKQ